ncbi:MULTISPECIES: response regulator transcription factor [unclassified Pseudomonas]|uniref:response regulator transcription factor n=1 Tax=unclassified Pseudomonas TaxID=196821 RepID=UPI002AC9A955|nr:MULTISPECIES: response regulator transcription factor [unclassified Pseudomonas]MEB0039917.1 response regulator transcription factor [Pseudomonas sp. MH10]MEB0077142.1 response regulator transcription factor [Pseudomonas sp. MH10out]MEB0093059.1 response regulator transcription factor [Pseudomonas sp. CCI4.2]MEB0102263.1 response regulator transcription factor [Pseudomonas sp. CCI3.2]MEB0123016.1 response regulator transcription factor [Pseudomonas sp. CCI1.2]
MTHVLIVEDDAPTANEIKAALQDHGFEVTCVDNGRDGLMNAFSGDFDIIVLDRMLPGAVDGLGVLTALRAAGIATPVLILSALSALDERVRGLRAGGDDYLTKPFEFIELTARLDALIRRRVSPPSQERESRLKVGQLDVDLLARTVRRGERTIDLLPREYALLEHLMRHAGQVITRTMLFEAVWNYSYDERTNVIEVHIGRLRRKVDGEGEDPMIHTVRGAGYVLRSPE